MGLGPPCPVRRLPRRGDLHLLRRRDHRLDHQEETPPGATTAQLHLLILRGQGHRLMSSSRETSSPEGGGDMVVDPRETPETTVGEDPHQNHSFRTPLKARIAGLRT